MREGTPRTKSKTHTSPIRLLGPIECNALLVRRQSDGAVLCRRSRNAERPAAPIDPEQLLAADVGPPAM